MTSTRSWSSHNATSEVDLAWQAFLRRFDIEHTFRMLKQTPGWTIPKLRSPEQGDRWTWLLIAAYTQLRLARGLTANVRHPAGIPDQRPAPRHDVTSTNKQKPSRSKKPESSNPRPHPTG